MINRNVVQHTSDIVATLGQAKVATISERSLYQTLEGWEGMWVGGWGLEIRTLQR